MSNEEQLYTLTVSSLARHRTKTTMPTPVNQPQAAYAAMGQLPGGIPIYASPVATFPYSVAGMAHIAPPTPQWHAGLFARPTAMGLARPELGPYGMLL